MNYYSQSGEDKYLYEHGHQLNLPETGTFIEVGAGDGIELSNTKMLEEMGWTGLVIEPNPYFTLPLSKNRTCLKEFCVVTNDPNDTSFICHDIPTWSGKLRKDGIKLNIHSRRLASILNEYQISYIDVLSIDTEGTEIDVLKSLDDYIDKVNVFIVEYDTAEIGNNKEELLDFLKEKFDLVETFQYNLLLKRRKQ